MGPRHHLPLDNLRYCAAPMVHQSDLPFRLQTVRHGATSTWTQMYLAKELNDDMDMLETLLKSLEMGRNSVDNKIRDPRSTQRGCYAPQVVQLAGNNVNELVVAAKKVAHYADAIDINLGCPQRHAEVGGYGAYLLPKQHWPKVTEMVSSVAQAVDLPITTKIRLTVPQSQTPDFAVQLSLAGSSVVTVHPRFASSVRRRKGLANLDVVRDVSDALDEQGLLRHSRSPQGDTAVISNGNVQSWADLHSNLCRTNASGVMVGETLLENPALFAPSIDPSRCPTPNELACEYLDLRQAYNAIEAPLTTAKQHLKYILAPQHAHIALPDQQLATWHRERALTSAKLGAITSEMDLLTFHHTLIKADHAHAT